VHRVGQAHAIADHLTVYENRHVLAQLTLVV
jgi:hypothetical protein